jgi:hypothetical protein
VSVQIHQRFFAGRVRFIYHPRKSIAQETFQFLCYFFEFDCCRRERFAELFARLAGHRGTDEVVLLPDLKTLE